jgi:type IV secretory pathway VirJ component
VSVVGLDSQKYFWNARTPEETARKIAEIAQYYLQYKEVKSFRIMGYSFGACVAPFIANKLPESLREKLSSLTLLSPDTKEILKFMWRICLVWKAIMTLMM